MPVFCFSDIEGSTQLWERFPGVMGGVIARHYAILEAQVPLHGGEIIKYTGDGMFALFEQGDPLGCCIAIQKLMQVEDWGELGGLRVRMALHAGEAEKLTHGDYYGTVANRTARLMSAAWGGQILVTDELLAIHRPLPPAQVEDLGFHLLKDLGQPIQIHGLVHPDFKLKKFPPLRSLSSHPNNLPVQATPFLGREVELAEIRDDLAAKECRLLTLLGPGGMGKTRLGLQAAAENLERFPHGTYWVALAHLDSAEQMVWALAEALKLNFYGGQEQSGQVSEERGRVRPRAQASQRDQLLAYLMEKELLLVLDNLEHLPGAPALLAEILSAAPRVKMLALSRERLALEEEWVLVVKGLSGPAAAALFLQRARRINANFTVSTEDEAAITRLCRLLEGLPLGLELAAAWLKTLTCAEIAAEMEKDLGFLATQTRNVPERHKSLRAAFEYSWKLLDSAEQAALTGLSVFRGGFDRKAAQAVAAASLGQLSSLADKSLLRQSGQGRHEIHGFLTGYAAEKLSEDPQRKADTFKLHARHYSEFLHNAEAALNGPSPRACLESMDTEINNLRQAWSWAVAHGAWDLVERSLESLSIYYGTRWLGQEGDQQLVKAADRLEQNALLGRVLSRRGVFCWHLGQKGKARELLNQALALAREGASPTETAFALLHLGCIAEGPDQDKFLRESLQISEQAQDKPAVAAAQRALGYYAGSAGDLFEAKARFEKSLSGYQSLGHQRGQSMARLNLGITAFLLGQTADAEQHCQKGLTSFTETGDRKGSATTTYWLGNCAEAAGDIPRATPLFEQALAEYRDLGQGPEVAWCLEHLGILARSRGERTKARDYFEQSHGLRKELDDAVGMVRSFAQMAKLATTKGGVAPKMSSEGRGGKGAFWPF